MWVANRGGLASSGDETDSTWSIADWFSCSGRNQIVELITNLIAFCMASFAVFLLKVPFQWRHPIGSYKQEPQWCCNCSTMEIMAAAESFHYPVRIFYVFPFVYIFVTNAMNRSSSGIIRSYLKRRHFLCDFSLVNVCVMRCDDWIDSNPLNGDVFHP